MAQKSERLDDTARRQEPPVIEARRALEAGLASPPIGKLAAVRAAAQRFLSTELGAREIRINKIAPADHGSQGWLVEAEILVPNLEVKMLDLPLTQEILEREDYALELEADLTIRSYELLGADNA